MLELSKMWNETAIELDKDYRYRAIENGHKHH
jgi:hypothetical protein